MKQISILFLSILLLFLGACAGDDNITEPDIDTPTINSEGLHFYGVRSSGTVSTDFFWEKEATIKVKFLNDPQNLKSKIQSFVQEWETRSNVKFNIVDSGDADVRIGFEWEGDTCITWSYIGTDCKNITDQNKATVNFAFTKSLSDADLRADVLRVFGQVLGYNLEHRHLNIASDWENKLKQAWTGKEADIPWGNLRERVFEPALKALGSTPTNEYDKNTIMLWPFPDKFLSNCEGNKNISENDSKLVADQYIKDEEVPTITPATTTLEFFSACELDMSKILTEGSIEITVDGVLAYNGNVSLAPKKLTGKLFKFKSSKLSLALTSRTENPSYMNQLKSVQLANIEYTAINIAFARNMTDLKLEGTPFFTQSDFSTAFRNCEKLTKIPAKLFDNAPNATSFYYTFWDCNTITEIPVGLFDKCTKVTNFESVFTSCKSIKIIPAGLFDKCTEVTNFSRAFDNCIGISSIPAGLFEKNTKVENFSGIFWRCYNITSIPDRLFHNCTLAKNFLNVFASSGINSIPPELFAKSTNATNFAAAFSSCSNITNIPATLFDQCPKVENFSNVFADCNFVNIPATLFNNNTKATNFTQAFTACAKLESIPAGLFDKCTNARLFEDTFSYCDMLTTAPTTLFDKCPDATNFSCLYYKCLNLTTKAPTLWVSHPNALSSMAFGNCTKMANYDEIPEDWK